MEQSPWIWIVCKLTFVSLKISIPFLWFSEPRELFLIRQKIYKSSPSHTCFSNLRYSEVEYSFVVDWPITSINMSISNITWTLITSRTYVTWRDPLLPTNWRFQRFLGIIPRYGPRIQGVIESLMIVSIAFVKSPRYLWWPVFEGQFSEKTLINIPYPRLLSGNEAWSNIARQNHETFTMNKMGPLQSYTPFRVGS